MADIDEMVDDAMWRYAQGVWFSGPYRVVRSAERGDYCLWYCTRTGGDGSPRNSVLLKRDFDTLERAKDTVEGHRELQRIKMLEKPLAP
jgi:hypothetical protein